MPIRLVKLDTEDEYSLNNARNDSIIFQPATIDRSGSPAQAESEVIEIEILAEDDYYENLEIQPVSEIAGILPQYSLDNTNWFDELTPGAVDDAPNGIIGNMDALGTELRKSIYFKILSDNDSDIIAGKYYPNLKLKANEYKNVMGEFGAGVI